MINGSRLPDNRVRLLRNAGMAALAGGVVLCCVGSLVTGLLEFLPVTASLHNALIIAVIALIAIAAGYFLKFHVANIVLAIVLVLIIRFIGVGPLLSTLLVLSAASVIGYPISKGVGVSARPISIVCGIAVLAGVSGWLLPFKIHNFFYYCTFLSAISLAGRRIVGQNTRLAIYAWRRAVSQSPRMAAFTALAVALAFMPTLLPTIQFDDLAYHLSLPTQLLSDGYYRMDVATQAWALAPWASDILHAYVAVLCGVVGYGAMNGAMIVMTALMLWVLSNAVGLKKHLRWFSILLYVTIPVVSQLNGGMQADSVITLATITLVAITALIINRKDVRLLLPFMIVSGLMMALKVTGGLLVAPLVLVVFVNMPWRAFLKRTIILTPAAVAVCGSSYYYAWFLTGNPIFPLYNAVFRSPYAPPVNFNDPRWHAGVSWHSMWDITFHTQHYQEVYPGAFGFTVLALSFCLMLCFMQRRWRLLILAVIVNAAAMFYAIQYARYIIPPVSALIPFALLAVQYAAPIAIVDILLSLTVLFNVAFIPNSLWAYVADVNWQLVKSINSAPGQGRSLIERKYTPEGVVLKYLNTKYHGQYTLYLANSGRPFTGLFGGHAIAASSYDPGFLDAVTIADKDPSGQTWMDLMERTGITQVLASHTMNAGLHEALRKANAVDALTIGDDTLWSLCRTACTEHASPLLEARDLSGYLRP